MEPGLQTPNRGFSDALSVSDDMCLLSLGLTSCGRNLNSDLNNRPSLSHEGNWKLWYSSPRTTYRGLQKAVLVYGWCPRNIISTLQSAQVWIINYKITPSEYGHSFLLTSCSSIWTGGFHPIRVLCIVMQLESCRTRRSLIHVVPIIDLVWRFSKIWSKMSCGSDTVSYSQHVTLGAKSSAVPRGLLKRQPSHSPSWQQKRGRAKMESHLFGENLIFRRIHGNSTKISILISLPHLAKHMLLPVM